MSFKKSGVKPKTPPNTSNFKIEKKVYDDPAEHAYAVFLQKFLPWLALEKFRTNTATPTDWSMIEYWLYFSEALVSLYDTEVPEDRVEMATNVGYGIQALYAIGKRYKDSGRTRMLSTDKEDEAIRVALIINDELKVITPDKYLIAVGRHVQRVLTQPQK